MTAPDLVRQILAAIEETEQDARAASAFGGPSWSVEPFTPSTPEGLPSVTWVVDEAEDGMAMVNGDARARHVARHDPASVLRRCAADRRIVEWCTEVIGNRDLSNYDEFGSLKNDGAGLAVTLAVETLQLLAAGYGITSDGPEPGSALARDLAEGVAQSQAGNTVLSEVVARDLAERAAASADVHQEEDWFIAQATSVDVASQGRTEEEARANLREAVELHLASRNKP